MSTVTCEIYGDVLIATFHGRIDRKAAPLLEAKLIEALAGARHIVCDLTEVSDVSSTGYRLLLRLYYEAATRAGEVALAGGTQEIRGTLAATGLRNFFVMAASLDEALSRLCQNSPGHASLT